MISVNILPAVFKRKINFMEDAHYTNKSQMLIGRVIEYQIFWFLNIIQIQEHILEFE